MSEVISGGITITIPTLGDVNWDQTIKNSCFTPISSHNHTGSGNGVTLGTAAFQGDSVNHEKIRLGNDSWLRGRNQANTADINVIKVTTANAVDVNILFATTAWAPTYSANGAMTWAASSDIARYALIGKICFIQLNAVATIGGVANTELRFTLPLTPRTSGGPTQAISGSYDNGVGVSGHTRCFIDSGASVARCERENSTNWIVGNAARITINGFYEIA